MNNHEVNENKSDPTNMAKKAGKGVIAYLSDWRNWVTHGAIGVGFVLAAIFVPVPVRIKILVFIVVVVFNCFRMRRKHKKH